MPGLCGRTLTLLRMCSATDMTGIIYKPVARAPAQTSVKRARCGSAALGIFPLNHEGFREVFSGGWVALNPDAVRQAVRRVSSVFVRPAFELGSLLGSKRAHDCGGCP